jgi:exopolyphosphatase / guanosine-5'-triphosphate,3'-diphosphate pyrophosphatase
MRIAIIDLGTNTFNLLIAEVSANQSYNILLETKNAAKLGKGGINNKTILPDAMDRGIDALHQHLRTIADYNVEKVVCIATAAIRSAKNGNDFVQLVKNQTGLDINVIDGQKEAQLIFDGIKQVVPLGDEKAMVLDIGGGSNEFIIANKEGVFWKHSFDLGVARLLDRFAPKDPIAEKEIFDIEAYFKAELQLLFDALKHHKVSTLIGSSGSFDTIAAMIAAQYHPHLDMSKVTNYQIGLPQFEALHHKFIASTIKERSHMPCMDPARIEMIVLASLFINFVIRKCGIKDVWQTSFALKEGAIYQIIRGML